MDNLNMGFEEEKPIVIKMEQVRNFFAEQIIAKSFLFVFGALLITAFAAYTTDIDTAYYIVSNNALYWMAIAELAVVFISDYAINRNKPLLAAVMYVVYSYLTGMLLSVIFLVYISSSVTSIFVITAVVFGVMAIYGLVTDTDLSGIGNICFMALIGVILSSVINAVILKNDVIDTLICMIGVLIFTGLAAYDTQKIKEWVDEATNETVLTLALYGGFELYLDFVYMFIKFICLFGKKRRWSLWRDFLWRQ